MTSLEIADMFNKPHSKVLEDIRNIVKRYIDDPIKVMQGMHRFRYKEDSCLFHPYYVLPKDLLRMVIGRYEGKLKSSFGERERLGLSVIEQLLKVKLTRQFRVGPYRIDGYDRVNNIAYEIDEEQHNSSIHRENDINREEYIYNAIGCTFVRIKV